MQDGIRSTVYGEDWEFKKMKCKQRFTGIVFCLKFVKNVLKPKICGTGIITNLILTISEEHL